MPDRRVPLDELRVLLLDPATSVAVRDAAWRYLIARSRGEGATWTVACAGMAMPMLAAALRECTSRGAGDREDIASAIVTGFVGALCTVALDRTGIASSLRWAALRAGLGVVRDALDTPAPRPHDELIADVLTGHEPGPGAGSGQGGVRSGSGPRSMPPPPRSAHPDLVLAAAVTDGVLTAAEADLIGETRLQRVSLVEVAARTGTPVGTIKMRRLRAELRLVGHLLGADDTAPDPAAPDRRASGHERSVSRTVTASAGTRAERLSAGGPDAARVESRRSPEVTGRRRRRTRGARRAGVGQVTR
ncbi:hypothetical protein [Pseudonocardia sp. HH130630-07]|uniref:hypothetical protein n=1 Tax=Pseudonocardia sp. HH130630-07 TaxID=1690815 RepID=UPI0012EA746B|nr:hypothetical protein [Pseudonocardia sp. HH130630-07]